MSRSFLVNLALAVLWLLLWGGGVLNFVVGWILGFLLLFSFRSILQSHQYTRRCLAFGRFLWVFLREFIWSNLVLARAILLQHRETLHPNFIEVDVSDLQSWEILLLSHCITLTPGTTAVDLVENGRVLIIHAFDGDNPESLRKGIEGTLKGAILEFSR